MSGHTAKEIVAARHLLAKKDRALARADRVTPPFDGASGIADFPDCCSWC